MGWKWGGADGGGGVKPTVDPVLAAIAALSQKMEKMVTKTDFEVLKEKIQKETKIIISEAVDPIKDALKENTDKLQRQIDEITEQMQNMGAGGGGEENKDLGHLQKQVDEIKENMKNTDGPLDPKIIGTDIVIGGLAHLSSLEEASKWLREILWTAYAPMPVETYIKRKDGVFAGLCFAKFASPTDRTKALSVVKTKLLELGGKEKWANFDLPTDVRAPEVFVIGLKKILVSPEWAFALGSVKYEINGPSKHLKVEGQIVVSVSCMDGGLVYEWEEK